MIFLRLLLLLELLVSLSDGALQVPEEYAKMPPAWTAAGMDKLCGKGSLFFFECRFTSVLPRLSVVSGSFGMGSADMGNQAWIDPATWWNCTQPALSPACNASDPASNCSLALAPLALSSANDSASTAGPPIVCSDPIRQLGSALGSLQASPQVALSASFWGTVPGGGYATGILAYLVLHLLAAIGMVVGVFFFIFLRYGGPVLRLPSVIHCGGAFPTRKGKGMCGFVELPGGLFVYTFWDKLYTMVQFVLFLVLILGLLASGQVDGNQGITKGLVALTQPEGGLGSSLANLIRGALPPMHSFLISTGSRALGPFLSDLNATMASPISAGGIGLGEMRVQLSCVNDSFSALPSGAQAQALLSDIAGSLGIIGANALALKGNMLALKGTAAAFSANGAQLSSQLLNISASINSTLLLPLATAAGNTSALLAVKRALLQGTGLTPGASNASACSYPAAPPLPCLVNDLTALVAFWPNASTLLSNAGSSAPSPPPWSLLYLADPAHFSAAPGSPPPTPGAPVAPGTYSGGYSVSSPLLGAGPVFRGAGALGTNLSLLMNTSLARIPDLSATAAAGEALNANLTYLVHAAGPLGGLLASLNATDAGLAALPPFSAFNGTLATLTSIAASVDFQPLIDASINIRDAISNFPDISGVGAQLSATTVLLNATPCLAGLMPHLRAINTTLYRLPPQFDALLLLVQSLQGLGPALGMISNATGAIQQGKASLRVINGTAIQYELLGLQATYRALTAAMNLTGLPALFSGFSAAALRAHLAGYRAQALGLNATLAAALLPPTLLTALRGTGANVTAASSAVAFGALEYAALAKGACNATRTLCASSADCPPPTGAAAAAGANTCTHANAGVRRCAKLWYPTPGEYGPPSAWYPPAFAPPGFPQEMAVPYWWLRVTPAWPGPGVEEVASGAPGSPPLYCNADVDCGAGAGGPSATGAAVPMCLGAYDRAAYLAGVLRAFASYDPRPTSLALAGVLGGGMATLGGLDVAGLSLGLSSGAAQVGLLRGIDGWREGIDSASAALTAAVPYSTYASLLDYLIATVNAVPVNAVFSTFSSLTAALDAFKLQSTPLVRMALPSRPRTNTHTHNKGYPPPPAPRFPLCFPHSLPYSYPILPTPR